MSIDKCVGCNKDLKFLNTPMFGVSKLKNGERLCTKCYQDVLSVMRGSVISLKKYEYEDVKNIIDSKLKRESNIKSDIDKLNLSRLEKWVVGPSLKYLSNVLDDNERVLNIISGKYNDKLGAVVATNYRLIFIDKQLQLFKDVQVEDFPYKSITSIKQESKTVFGKITIYMSGNSASIDDISSNLLPGFVVFIRKMINNQVENNSKGVTGSLGEETILDKIEKLGKLRDANIITEEEFNLKKVELLDKI